MNSYTGHTLENRFFTLLVTIYILSVFFPIMNTIGVSFVMGLLIATGMLFFPQRVFQKPFYMMCCFILVAIIYFLFGKGLPIISLALISLSFLSSIVVTVCLDCFSIKQLKFLYYLLLGLLLYAIIGTFLILLDNPMAVRMFGYGQGLDIYEQSQYFQYKMRGLFSYGFGEALAIFLPALLAFALYSRNKINSIICILIILGGTITQLMGSLTTSFLLTIVFCIFVLLSYFSVKRKKSSIGIVLLAMIPFAFFVSSYIEYNTQFVMKMDDITDSYSEGHMTGQVQTRGNLYLQSISVCLSNPILGFGDYPHGSNTEEKTVGLHSTVFDYWGLFGVFVLILYYAWKSTINVFLHELDKNRRKAYRWYWLSLLGLLLLKGPVTLGTNFLFSTVFVGLLCSFENRILSIKN